MAKKTTPTRTIRVYKSYNFVDKDPAIDFLRTAINKSGHSRQYVADTSGVALSTLSNWFDGQTRRPQFATLEAAARSVGYTFKLTRNRP